MSGASERETRDGERKKERERERDWERLREIEREKESIPRQNHAHERNVKRHVQHVNLQEGKEKIR